MFESKFVQKTELKVDLKALRKDFEALVEKYPLSKKHWQLALNSHINSSVSPFEEVDQFEANHYKTWHMLDIYKGTEFEKLYRQMESAPGIEFCRARINVLFPQSCLAFHADRCGRYIVALFTNSESFVIFENEPLYHIPSDSSVYHLDAWIRHTVLNCGDLPRVHIVFDEKNPKIETASK
jgi:hypothetical protein